MDAAETRGYIEHRLHQVDWKGSPGFDDEAFARIFHWTHGIPRRVNMLCNRLLLAAYLASESRVAAKDVDVVGAELLGEVGEAGQLGSRGEKGRGRGLGVVRRSDS
jgi:hypothetical protein